MVKSAFAGPKIDFIHNTLYLKTL